LMCRMYPFLSSDCTASGLSGTELENSAGAGTSPVPD
jgi:hypothetical protein